MEKSNFSVTLSNHRREKMLKTITHRRLELNLAPATVESKLAKGISTELKMIKVSSIVNSIRRTIQTCSTQQ